MLRCFCLQFWNFAVLSILHMPYLSPFFSVLLSWNRYVCLVPPHLQGPVIVCAVFASPPFVGPACGPSLPQGGNDDTYFYRYTRDFFFFFLLIFCFRAVVTPQ